MRTIAAVPDRPRARRVFRPDGRTLIAAVDHAMFMDVGPSLRDPGGVVETVVAGGADAVIATFGVARRFGPSFGARRAVSPGRRRADGALRRRGGLAAPVLGRGRLAPRRRRGGLHGLSGRRLRGRDHGQPRTAGLRLPELGPAAARRDDTRKVRPAGPAHAGEHRRGCPSRGGSRREGAHGVDRVSASASSIDRTRSCTITVTCRRSIRSTRCRNHTSSRPSARAASARARSNVAIGAVKRTASSRYAAS